MGGSYHAVQTDASAAIKRKLEQLSLEHVKALFATKKLACSTSLIMAVWAFIGLGYPLYNAFIPFIQATKGAEFGDGSTYLTYRNSLIIAVLGVPGALLGGALIEIPRFGRRGTLAVSTVLTGVFLYASTTALTSAALLGWQCAFNFFSNIVSEPNVWTLDLLAPTFKFCFLFEAVTKAGLKCPAKESTSVAGTIRSYHRESSLTSYFVH